MYIKIYKKSQLVLLRSLLPIIKKKYRIPVGIFDKIEVVFESRKLGRTGFIAILLEPIKSGNDVVQIQDTLNCYPHQLELEDNIEDVPIKEENTWLTKGREWYMDTWKIKKEESYIYILYFMDRDVLYGKGYNERQYKK